MGTIADKGNLAWRDYVVDGVPASSVQEPLKSEIRDFVAEVDKLVDTMLSGVRWNALGVDAATTAALPAYSYANGASGVGATITASVNGAFPTIDGVAAGLNKRYLVRHGTNGAHNGVYVLTQVGDGSNPFVLTRTTDADSAAEFERIGLAVKSGTTQTGWQYVLPLSAAEITVGTTALTFALFSAQTGLATINSPTFTGTPAAPTAAPGTNTTQLATTEFVTTVTTGLDTRLDTVEAANVTMDLRVDVLDESFGLDGLEFDFALLCPWLDEDGKLFGGFTHGGDVGVSNLVIGYLGEDELDTFAAFTIADENGNCWIVGRKDGRVNLTLDDDSIDDILQRDGDFGVSNLVIGHLAAEDELDTFAALTIGDEDGNYWIVLRKDGRVNLMLDDDSIDDISDRISGTSSEVPTSLVAAADAVAKPRLGYVQSTDEEGWPVVYAYRLDVAVPLCAVAMSGQPVELCPSDGQSNNVGGGSQTAKNITTPPYPHRALTLTGSPNGGGPVFSTLDPLVEADIDDLVPIAESALQPNNSPTTGKMRLMQALDLAADLEPPVRIAWASGIGGRNIAELMSGTQLYTNDMLCLQKAIEHALAYEASKIICYVRDFDQGEEDRSDSVAINTWLASYTTYRQDKEDDTRALTRQTEPVWHNLRGLCKPSAGAASDKPLIEIAHYRAMNEVPRTTIAFCDYFLEGTYGMTDTVHFTSLAYDLRGEYMGKSRRIITRAMKAAIAAGIDPWDLTIHSELLSPGTKDIRTCLRVSGASRVGSTVTLDLVLPEDGTTVVEDTVTLPAANAAGIVKGITASTGPAVTAVAVTNPSAGVYKLEVTLASGAAGTLRGGVDIVDALTADRSSAWMNFKAPSSVASIAVGGLNLDNWLIPFEISYS